MVENLKKLRQKSGISQQALAERLGISQQSINKYENHKIEPDISTLIAMADFFETTIDYLVGRTTQEGKQKKMQSSEQFLEKYQKLDENERTCVNLIVNTFYDQKNKKNTL